MPNAGTMVKTIQFNNSNTLPDLSTKHGSEITAAVFGLNANTIKDVANTNRMYRSKHGLFSSVPIICQDADCKYKDICVIDPANRTFGQRCPMEVAAIIARYEQWCAHFDINYIEDEVDPKDLVDATLIKDLVVTEVQMLRAENKIALNGDFMAETLLDIDKKCKPYYGEIISPEAEFLLTLQDRKIKILNQLNATRKDKSQDKRREAASDEAIRIFQKIKEMESMHNSTNMDITDVEFDENGNIVINESEYVEVGDTDNAIKEENNDGQQGHVES